MATEQLITITGQATLNEVDSIAHYGDIKRVYTPGGILVTGSATLNDVDSNVHYGDIRRVYTPGGISVKGSAELNATDAVAHYGDLKRVYTPGGISLTGKATLNDTDSNVHYGDILKIAFVTLSPMTDTFPLILSIAIPAEAISWLQNEVNTSCYCCKITRTDGVVLAFTSHDTDLVIDGVTYKAKPGFDPTAVSTSNDMSTDNLDNAGVLSDDSITAEDIKLGKYHNAAITVFQCDYSDLTLPVFILRRGWIGEITYGKNSYTAEIRGMMENFSKKSGKITSRTCRTDFGDAKCKMNTAAYTFTGTVTDVNSDGSFKISVLKDKDYFSYGLITFTSGVNSGASMEVKSYAADGTTALFLPLPNGVELNSTVTIVAGCDGNATTCRNRFNNIKNMRAEFYTPGNNYIQSYASSEAGNIVSEGKSPKRAVYDWGDE
jgi:uncharacterized phage protein (TIGR02218 family)